MSFLSGLVGKFDSAKFYDIKKDPKKLEPKIDSDSDRDGIFTCEKCGSAEGWEMLTPGGPSSESAPWRCLHCDPPAARWMVRRTTRDGPKQAIEARRIAPIDMGAVSVDYPETRATLTAMAPICGQCGSRWFVEYCSRDGGIAYQCWCCRSSIDAQVVAKFPVLVQISQATKKNEKSEKEVHTGTRWGRAIPSGQKNRGVNGQSHSRAQQGFDWEPQA